MIKAVVIGAIIFFEIGICIIVLRAKEIAILLKENNHKKHR